MNHVNIYVSVFNCVLMAAVIYYPEVVAGLHLGSLDTHTITNSPILQLHSIHGMRMHLCKLLAEVNY